MREYLLVLFIAAAMTYLATPLVRWVAVRVGAFTQVRERDVHAVPTPRLGGVGMFLGFAAAMLVASRLPYLSQLFDTGALLGVLVGGAIMCALGAIDDVHELDWLTKLAGQMIAAGVMAFSGVQLLSLPISSSVTILPAPILVALTVVIVVVTTNAVNWLDGLDGLAAGLVGISATALFVWSYLVSRSFDPPNVFSSATFITAAVIGCCLGFLPHNFHPARLFMGDAGALLLGLLLAAATISMTSVDPRASVADSKTAFWLPLAMVVGVLILPLLDMSLAILRRLHAGRDPWQPDSRHLHRDLLRLGHSHRQAVLIMYLWAAVASFGVLSFALVPGPVAIALVGGALVCAILLTWGLPKWRPGQRL